MATAPAKTYPPRDTLLTAVLDFNLEHNPHVPFYHFARDGDPAPTDITHLEFGRAAHRAAHAIRPNRAGADGRVVALLAQADTILYQAVSMGIVVAGLVVRAIIHIICRVRGSGG
ncbi:hypothetical protein PLICRDRAFT_117628 [Plicaturopsis crispa FD-325 SS-3]|uniref:AMP-dependent synthetase/ligase domain-containing protein n=1 Tax=Plicaturopsis crispa FD-325 SS-3 TaxID=944288 RepID=A0A0C9SXR6_PLICR|nr:hypothetical protein PLICRDRAFT_117628 [Plicaturopsis crispa FD-325 SS-3]